MSTRLRRAALGGYAAPLVATGSILGAAILAGNFDVQIQALSDLGVTAGAAPVFNYGLILAGLLGLPFGAALWWSARNRLEQAGAIVFGGATLALAGVGAFPSDTALHAPAAIGFFLAFTYALFLVGSGAVLAGDRERGLVLMWLGIGHISIWLLWAGTGITSGIALPELGGSAILAMWTVSDAHRFRQRPGSIAGV